MTMMMQLIGAKTVIQIVALALQIQQPARNAKKIMLYSKLLTFAWLHVINITFNTLIILELLKQILPEVIGNHAQLQLGKH